MTRASTPCFPALGGFVLVGGLIAAGCTSDEWPPLPDEAGTTSDATSDESSTGPGLEGATLRVFEPLSASIHRIGEALPLIAEVQDPFGAPSGFEHVLWYSDNVEFALHDTAMGEAVLEPGIHQITAIAELPGGDRLVTSVGDVRIQAGSTGQWQGDASLTLSVDFMGAPLSPRCRGPLAFTFDITGETFTAEDGSCVLDVILAQLDVTYTIDGTRAGNFIEGTINYNFLGFANLPIAWAGTFRDGELSGAFGGPVNIPLVGESQAGGTLTATKISPYLDP